VDRDGGKDKRSVIETRKQNIVKGARNESTSIGTTRGKKRKIV